MTYFDEKNNTRYHKIRLCTPVFHADYQFSMLVAGVFSFISLFVFILLPTKKKCKFKLCLFFVNEIMSVLVNMSNKLNENLIGAHVTCFYKCNQFTKLKWKLPLILMSLAFIDYPYLYKCTNGYNRFLLLLAAFFYHRRFSFTTTIIAFRCL